MRHIHFKIAAVIALLPLLMLAGQSAWADGEPKGQFWTNDKTEIHPEIGPQIAGMEPGKNGYKVFGPGALKRAVVQPEKAPLSASNRLSPLSATDITWRGASTDAWRYWNGPFQYYDDYGSHTSDSDGFEDEIFADGYLRNTGYTTGWRASCSDRHSGSRAWCQSHWISWYMCLYAETKHHFHTNGYVDWNPTTADTDAPFGCDPGSG